MLWEHLMSNLYFAVEQRSQNEVNNVKKKKKKKKRRRRRKFLKLFAKLAIHIEQQD